MTITGINYKFIMFSPYSDHISEAVIPFMGDDPVITQTIRESYETTVTKFPLSRETIDQYLALIDEYKITEWIGKTPAAPEVFNDENLHESSLLTLLFDDGSSAEITFREVPKETGKEAEKRFRILFFASTKNELKLSEEKHYPNLKECREIKEIHGPVVAVETSHFSSGMMYNSNVTVKQKIEKVPGKEGVVLVTVSRKAGNLPEETDCKETSSDILSKVQEISDRENIPGWHYACVDPSIPVDRSMMPLDYSSSSSLNIYYDDSLITGCPRVKRTIGEKACDMGGRETDRTITEMVNECVSKSGAKVEVSTVNPYIAAQYEAGNIPQTPVNGFTGMGMGMFMNPGLMQQAPASPAEPAPSSTETTGQSQTAPASNDTWNCGCGAKGLTGKFCPECGYPRK